MGNVLTVRVLGKSFKSKQIIQNISFDVRKGEIMAISGPNGAGKSTTIRNIMGIMMYGKNATPKEIWKSMWA